MCFNVLGCDHSFTATEKLEDKGKSLKKCLIFEILVERDTF